MKRFIVFLLALAAMVGGAAAADASSVLVVPARLRVVRLAFDIAAIRHSALVTYQFYPGSSVVQLHRWDGAKWESLSEGDFGSGAFLAQPVRQAIFIGTKEMPESLVESSVAWGPDAKVIESIDIGQLVNELNTIFRFESSELKWLADRHELKIEDTNAARRRYGRYGPPGAKVPARAPAPAAETAQTLQPLTVKLDPIPASADVPLPAPVPVPVSAPAIEPANAAPAASNAAPAKAVFKPEDK